MLSEISLCGIEMRQKLTSQLEELLKNQRRGFDIILLEHSRMYACYAHLCLQFQSNSIGMEWKDTYVVMNAAAESSCSNNGMRLDTLIRRE